MARKKKTAIKEKVMSWEFGKSIVTDRMIKEMEREGYFAMGRATLPPPGQVTPDPDVGYAVVFRDFFTCGVRFPSKSFLCHVLVAFNLQIHHLTPHGFLALSKFCWACESFGAKPNIDTFCAYYELQKQPNRSVVDGVETTYQYGSCAFMPRRHQVGERPELSFCQKGKWERGWLHSWFYFKSYSVTTTFEDGGTQITWPLASIMSEMEPIYKVDPLEEVTPERLECDKAFAMACRYSGGRDLVEGMMASDYWPLGKRNPDFELEHRSVRLIGFDGEVEIPFPRFGRELSPKTTAKEFVAEVEEGARLLVGKVTDKEYAARRSSGGAMRRLNRVFSKIGVELRERGVPADVFAACEEDKGKKGAVKNTTVAESRKRKGSAAPAGPSKKLKGVESASASMDSTASSTTASTSTTSDDASLSATDAGVLGACSGTCSGGGALEPSAVDPMPELFGDDSGDERVDGVPQPSILVVGARSRAALHQPAAELSDGDTDEQPPPRQPPEPQVADSAEVGGCARTTARVVGPAPCFLGSVINTLAKPEEAFAAGASIGRVGLELPPLPPVTGFTPRPQVPGMPLGPSASDTTITGYAENLHVVYSRIRDRLRQHLRNMDYFQLLRVQLEHHSIGHHMAAAIEERSTCEVIDRNSAIDALKREYDLLDAEKTRLHAEVGSLTAVRTEVDVLKKSVEQLKSDADAARQAATKAQEDCDGLRARLTAEKEAVGGSTDFGALAGVTNFAKILQRSGCSHAEGVQKEQLSGASELGATSQALRRSVRNFMTSFWVPYGRSAARQMADERKTEGEGKRGKDASGAPPPATLGTPSQSTSAGCEKALDACSGEVGQRSSPNKSWGSARAEAEKRKEASGGSRDREASRARAGPA